MDLGDSSALQSLEDSPAPSPVVEQQPPAAEPAPSQSAPEEAAPATEPAKEAAPASPADVKEPAPEPVAPEAPAQASLQQAPQPVQAAPAAAPAPAPTPAAAPAPAPAPAAPAAENPTPFTPVDPADVLPVLQAGQPIRVQPPPSLSFNANYRAPVQQTPYLPQTAVPNAPAPSNAPVTVTDTSVGPPVATELPGFATPSPYVPVVAPDTSDVRFGSQAPPPVAAYNSRDSYANDLNAKSKAFNQRVDYMIGEFFSRQVSKLASNTPEAVDRNYRIFQQKMKERLGQQWAHITAQPEVDEAVKQVQAMHEYFTYLEKMVDKQKLALQMLNDVEAELSLFYQQKGYQEEIEDVGRNLVHMGINYHHECKERQPLITSLEAFASFIKTFNSKAIGDCLDTIKRQATARQELDSYGSKLGSLEEKRIKAQQKGLAGSDDTKYAEKDLQQTRARFQAAKEKYQNLSTQVIDKAGLLEMKRGVDFASYLEKLVEANDAYTRIRIDDRKANGKLSDGVQGSPTGA